MRQLGPAGDPGPVRSGSSGRREARLANAGWTQTRSVRRVRAHCLERKRLITTGRLWVPHPVASVIPTRRPSCACQEDGKGGSRYEPIGARYDSAAHPRRL